MAAKKSAWQKLPVGSKLGLLIIVIFVLGLAYAVTLSQKPTDLTSEAAGVNPSDCQLIQTLTTNIEATGSVSSSQLGQIKYLIGKYPNIFAQLGVSVTKPNDPSSDPGSLAASLVIPTLTQAYANYCDISRAPGTPVPTGPYPTNSQTASSADCRTLASIKTSFQSNGSLTNAQLKLLKALAEKYGLTYSTTNAQANIQTALTFYQQNCSTATPQNAQSPNAQHESTPNVPGSSKPTTAFGLLSSVTWEQCLSTLGAKVYSFLGKRVCVMPGLSAFALEP